jgi:hypothetical protein
MNLIEKRSDQAFCSILKISRPEMTASTSNPPPNKSTDKPVLFVLAPRVPNPTEKGDKLRMRQQLEELGAYFDIHLTCLAFGRTKQADFDAVQPLVKSLHIERLPRWRALVRLALAPLAKRPYQVMLYTDRWAKRRIRARISTLNPDRIYCQMIRTSEYVKDCYSAPKTLDIMDTLSVGMAREADRAAWWKRGLLRSESRRLKLYEHRMIGYFESCCIISEQDRDLLPHADKRTVHVVPNGVRTPAFEQLTGRTLKLLLCGASPSAAVRSLARTDLEGNPQIEVRGWVDDIRTAYLDAEIFAAPMLISTGQQNKLFEAMSLAIPCVTTPLSFNALDVTEGREIWVCEKAEEFAKAFDELLKNPTERSKLGAAGCKHVRKSCSWEAATLKLASILTRN